MKTMMRQAAVAGLVGLVVLAWGGRSFGQTETVTNGGFELDGAGWQTAGPSNAQISTNPPNYAGTAHLAISTVPGATQGVYQIVTLPANTIAATFSCYYNIQSTDGAQAGNAWMWVRVTDATGMPLAASSTIFNTNRDVVQGTYHQLVFDLTPFAQTNSQFQVQFWVAAAADAMNGGTIFNFDSVSLQAVDISARPANDAFANAALLTNTTAFLYATNTYATKEPGEPKHAGNAGGHSLWWTWTAPAYGTLSITTDGSGFDTLLAAYTGTVVGSLTAVAANNDDNGGANTTSAVSFKVSPGTQYQIAVDGADGATGIILLSLNFKQDTTGPSLSFISPASGAKVTSPTLTVTGKASDGFGLALVTYRLENTNGIADYLPATGTTNWSATVSNLTLGLNTVRVQGYDTSSNLTTATRSFTYVLGADYSLSIAGTGTVSPDLSKQLLLVGKSYTLTAKPGRGFVFSNWTGSASSSAAKLAFVMQSNMVLQANFIPNPFTPAKGAYAGLFTNSVPETNSGYFSATVTDGGGVSARVQTGGRTYRLSGQFAVDGSFLGAIQRHGQEPLWVLLQLDLNGGDIITGTVMDGDQTASLIANRAVFSRTANPAPMSGRYTLAMAGAGGPATAPGGYGFGALSVDTSGNVSFSGTLGDGTKVAQRTFLSKDGAWPLYLSLYGNQGAMYGWLGITNSTGGGLLGGITNGGLVGGFVNWSKPPQPKAKLYPEGFPMEQLFVLGTSYTYTKNTPALSLTNGGLLTLEGGNLTNTLSVPFQLGVKNKVASTNGLALTFNAATGLFQGKVPNPATGKPIAFSGALIQGLNGGEGCFLGTNQSGTVSLGPLP